MTWVRNQFIICDIYSSRDSESTDLIHCATLKYYYFSIIILNITILIINILY